MKKLLLSFLIIWSAVSYGQPSNNRFLFKASKMKMYYHKQLTEELEAVSSVVIDMDEKRLSMNINNQGFVDYEVISMATDYESESKPLKIIVQDKMWDAVYIYDDLKVIVLMPVSPDGIVLRLPIDVVHNY